MSEPREFWIKFPLSMRIKDLISCIGNIGSKNFWPEYKDKVIHVIEKSAYDNLEAQLKVAVEALEFYSTAFEKKLTESLMGEFTPFNVDRGLQARKALQTIKDMEQK